MGRMQKNGIRRHLGSLRLYRADGLTGTGRPIAMARSEDGKAVLTDPAPIPANGFLKVYDMPIKKYNIKKEEAAFLSANTWDVSGGGNYGFSSIWVNRNNNIFDYLDYKPKKEISELNQLLDIL